LFDLILKVRDDHGVHGTAKRSLLHRRYPCSLDSVVYAFLSGESPEGIAESFPALGLEQIFGALAFYTANRELVDRYLSRPGRV
jgi:hypothetical protein